MHAYLKYTSILVIAIRPIFALWAPYGGIQQLRVHDFNPPYLSHSRPFLQAFLDYLATSYCRAVGVSENPGMPLVMCWHNLPPSG